ncbi:MAG: hypothetical protein KUL78_03265 [Flavobacterium sp.]|nr:hypothetical protein [Flavobacterium sp.]
MESREKIKKFLGFLKIPYSLTENEFSHNGRVLVELTVGETKFFGEGDFLREAYDNLIYVIENFFKSKLYGSTT